MTKQNKKRAIIAAILAIIISVATAVLSIIDGDPKTIPDVPGTVQEVQEQIGIIKEIRNPEMEDEDADG